MSTEATWAAPAAGDIDRELELDDTEHARDALLRHGWDGPEEEARDHVSVHVPSLFGGGADRRALEVALRRLHPVERRVVRLRLYGHESADTIADVLDLPRTRVALLLERSLSRIRHDLLT